VGIASAKLVVANPATFVSIGNFSDPKCRRLASAWCSRRLDGQKSERGDSLGIWHDAVRNFSRDAHGRVLAPCRSFSTLLQLDLRGAAHFGLLEITLRFSLLTL